MNEAFEFAKQSQIDTLKAMKKELQDISKLTGEDVGEQTTLLDNIISGVENTDFTKVIDKLKIELPKVISSVNQDTKIEFDLSITPEAEATLKEKIDDLAEDIVLALEDSLNSNFAQVVGGADEFLNNFSTILTESTNIQLEENQRLLDERIKQRQALEGEIDKEKELFEKGLANNLGVKQEEYQRLLEQEENYQLEQDKLRQKAQRVQLLSDTLTQSTSLVTASANIIKGFSQIPFIGLPLGIAAVGTMLAFFAKTKVDAFKATKLSKGADKISDYFGFADEYGDTDLGRNKGYNVINATTGKDTGVVISGREMILPENVSFEYKDVLNAMKDGSLKKYNLDALLKQDKGQTINTTIIEQPKPKQDMQWLVFTRKDGSQFARLTKVTGKNEGDTIEFKA